ncbi:MAG: hypothetical protein JJU36_06945 [Phycisphaeraceae bacterium]|nr:hypothetical protein [Phycisphaeraceae bacterium]
MVMRFTPQDIGHDFGTYRASSQRPRWLIAAITAMVAISAAIVGISADPPMLASNSAAEDSEVAAPPTLAAEALRPLIDRDSFRVHDMALLPDKTILATDGTEHLVLLHETGRRAGTIHLTINRYYSESPLRTTADGGRVLIADQWVDLERNRLDHVLRVSEAVRMGNPNPEPLDVSADGALALVHVRSFSAARHNALAIFDTESGRVTHRVRVGEGISHAAFAGRDRVVIGQANGRIVMADFAGQTRREFRPVVREDQQRHWHYWQSVRCEQRHHLLVGRGERFVLFDITAGETVVELDGLQCAVLDESNRYLITRQRPDNIKAAEPEPLRVHRIADGRIIAHLAGPGWSEQPRISDLRHSRLYTLSAMRTIRPWRIEIEGVMLHGD